MLANLPWSSLTSGMPEEALRESVIGDDAMLAGRSQ